MNRVQLQPGLSMFEFLKRYGTEEQCEARSPRLRLVSSTPGRGSRRHHREEHVWCVLREPCAHDEDTRRVHRELLRLTHERVSRNECGMVRRRRLWLGEPDLLSPGFECELMAGCALRMSAMWPRGGLQLGASARD